MHGGCGDLGGVMLWSCEGKDSFCVTRWCHNEKILYWFLWWNCLFSDTCQWRVEPSCINSNMKRWSKGQTMWRNINYHEWWLWAIWEEYALVLWRKMCYKTSRHHQKILYWFPWRNCLFSDTYSDALNLKRFFILKRFGTMSHDMTKNPIDLTKKKNILNMTKHAKIMQNLRSHVKKKKIWNDDQS